VALISRNDADSIILELGCGPEFDQVSLFLFKDGVVFPKLDVALRIGHSFVLRSSSFLIERIALLAKSGLGILVVDDLTNKQLTEKVSFEPSFFIKHLDFSTSETFPPYDYEAYKKPEKLAVFTHASNEDVFLKIFVDYYKKLVDPQHIYIIDHGSDFISEWLSKTNRECQVVRIPKGAVDHLNIKRYVEYFQRFLLTQYQWVLHVDCDELLVHRNGPRYLVDSILDKFQGAEIRPELGLNLVQDPDREQRLDLDQPITQQRRCYQVADGFDKPVLSSVPTTWGLGFHKSLRDSKSHRIENLFLIHLAYASVEERVRRNQSWQSYVSSGADSRFVSQLQRSSSEQLVINELREMLKSQPFDCTGWFDGFF
jgi:hypothetical protein